MQISVLLALKLLCYIGIYWDLAHGGPKRVGDKLILDGKLLLGLAFFHSESARSRDGVDGDRGRNLGSS
jgi:hypothetical protein